MKEEYALAAKEFLHYFPGTGLFRWKVRDAKWFKSERDQKIWNTKNAGNVAGAKHGEGYISISILGKEFLAHRLAMLFTLGHIPEGKVDHINHNRADNRKANLRVVDDTDHARNTGSRRGICGVYQHKNGRWYATIGHKSKTVNLGSSLDFFEVCCLRKSAENRYGYHANHGRRHG